jgi:hypothetical protein
METDGAGGRFQAARLFGTRRAAARKMQRDHFAAARRQAGHRFAYHLLPLDLLEHGGRDRTRVAQLVHVLPIQIELLFDLAPPPVITLVRRHPDQPSL